MIKPKNLKSFLSERKKTGRYGLAAVSAALVMSIAGCGEEPPPVVKKKPPPPPVEAPPPPSVKSIESLMAELGIDDRVELPEARAPGSTEARIALLTFFDAFARGDDASVKMMVPYLDQKQLTALVDNGSWEATVDVLYAIEIETGQSPDGEPCTLAFFDVDGRQQAQMWFYSEVDGGGWEFESQPTPEDIMSFLQGDDMIEAWFKRWDEEMRIAELADVEIDWSRVDLDGNGDGDSDGGGYSPGSTPSPMSPGGLGRRKPTPPPRRPPGPGGPGG